MGGESQIEGRKLSPLAQQKIQELVALLAEDRFEDHGRPPKQTTFATIEDFGHQAGQAVAQAGADVLTFHAEVCADDAELRATVDHFRDVGVAEVGVGGTERAHQNWK